MMQMIWKHYQDDESGFTLVELLVVIVILGVLGGVAVFAVGGISSSSKTSACKTDVATVQAASDAYYTQNNNTYAADMPALKAAKFLRSVPSSTSYVVTYTASDGSVVGGTTGAPTGGCP